MKIHHEEFCQLISELSADAEAVNEKSDRNDDNGFLLGKKEAYHETLETIKKITNLTDNEILDIRRRFPSYKSICFETMNGISSELKKCFQENNIYTVGDLAEYSGQDILSILNKNGNNVASLLVLYMNNNIPTKYLNELAKIYDEYVSKRREQIARGLEDTSRKLDKLSRDLSAHKKHLNQIKAELDKLYIVSSIDFSDIDGNKSEDENAPMRIITISNSKDEQLLFLSAAEVLSKGIKVGSCVTVEQEKQ